MSQGLTKDSFFSAIHERHVLITWDLFIEGILSSNQGDTGNAIRFVEIGIYGKDIPEFGQVGVYHNISLEGFPKPLKRTMYQFAYPGNPIG